MDFSENEGVEIDRMIRKSPKNPPKYTSVDRVQASVRPHADQLSEDDILKKIEEAEENRVDAFLIACGFDLDNLDVETSNLARDLATYRAIEALTPLLPITETFREALFEGFRRLGDDVEKSFASRKKLTIQKVRAVMKEIEEESVEL